MSIPLSIPLWLPAVVGLAGLFLPGRVARLLAIAATLATLAYAIGLVADFDRGGGLQHATDRTWIAELGIHYKIGVDGLNLFLVALTALLWAAAVVWASRETWERERLFWFFLLLGETAVLGALLSQDLALFVAFFDLMLIPFYFLAGMWGPPGIRVPAVTKLVIYTLVGSLLMLAAAVATAVISAQQGDTQLTFVLSDLQRIGLPKGSQEWIFLCFAAAFLVKMPLFPLHGWMPDGYRAMPLPVLVVFSGVLSKVAAYGFLRIVLPIFPDASAHFQMLMLLIALASILYGSAMAFTTTQARLILGYSSVAQLGFIVLGIFSLRNEGAQGALLQAFNHGLVVAPAFLIVALLAARAGGSEDIRDMGGIAFRAPVLAALFLIVALATLAMPGSANFAAEFLILLGVFRAKIVIAIVAFTGVAMAAVYMLRMFIRTMHNRTGPAVESRELRFTDGLVIAPLVAAIVGFALYPQLALDRSEPSVVTSVRQARALTLPPAPPRAGVNLGKGTPPPVTPTPQGTGAP